MKQGVFNDIPEVINRLKQSNIYSGTVNSMNETKLFLKSLAQNLTTSNARMSNIIYGLTQQADIFSDKLDSLTEDTFGVVEKETFDNIIQCFHDNTDSVSQYIAITITDAQGHVFNVVQNTINDIVYINDCVFMKIEDGAYYICNRIRTKAANLYVTLSQLIKDLVSSCALNDFIIGLSNTVTNVNNRVTNIIATIQEYATSKWSSVKSTASACLTAFRQSGVPGIIQYLVDMISGLVRGRGDEYTFSPTDSSVYTPAAFSAGILNALYVTGSLALGAIVSVINPILGLATSVITYGLTYGLAYYKESVNMEYASVNMDEEGSLPFTPYVGFSGIFTLPGVGPQYGRVLDSDHPIVQAINEGYLTGYYRTYGGWILYGVSNYYNNQPHNVTVEFHPDLIDRRSTAQWMLNYLRTKEHGSCFPNPTSYAQYVGSQGNISYYKVGLGVTIVGPGGEAIESYYTDSTMNDPASFQRFSNEQEGDHIGYVVSDEDRMIRVLVANLIVFRFACFGHTGGTIVLTVDMNLNASTTAHLSEDDAPTGVSLNDNYILWFWKHSNFLEWNTNLPDIKIGSTWRGNLLIGSDQPITGNKWTLIARLFNGSKDSVSWQRVDWVDLMPVDETKGYFNYTPAYKFNGSDVYLNDGSQDFCLFTPKYIRNSVLSTIILASIGIAVAAVIGVATTLTVKKKLSTIRAVSSAKVGKAWDALQDNPSDATYMAYRKAVKKNNRLVSIIGGTKFDIDDYWFGNADSNADSILNSTSTSVSNSDKLDIIKALIKKD